jgi:uncharacterized membrane protein
MIVLRFLHVVSGAIWVGMLAFVTFFLMPALNQAGPDAAKVMGPLGRRVPVVMPTIALITLVSGFWLFQRLSGGAPGALLKTPVGLAFGLGGLAALLAFLIGVFVGRPAMMRGAKLAESLPTAPPGERPARMAEMQRLRARGTAVQQVVTWLVLFTLAAMAIARYV